MSYSRNTTSTNCCKGILHRILCTGNLPTAIAPSSARRFNESNTPEFEPHRPGKVFHDEARHKVQVSAPSKPNIVARLMGLDSLLPVPGTTAAAPMNATSESTLRSVNNFVNCDFSPSGGGLHRRARTTKHSAPTPPCSQMAKEIIKENNGFISSRKSDQTVEGGFQEPKQDDRDNAREGVIVKKKKEKKKSQNAKDHRIIKKPLSRKASSKDEDQGQCYPHNKKYVKSRSGKTLIRKEESVTSESIKNNGKCRYAAYNKTIVPECNSDNSTPATSKSHETSMSVISNSRKKNVSLNETGCEYPLSSVIAASDQTYNNNNHGWMVAAAASDDEAFKSGVMEEICMEIGQGILQQLLNQVVRELVEVGS